MRNEKKWVFFRAGGCDQVKLETGADLLGLDDLDQKLWVALACPTSGLELESRTLAMIDSDKDGRVRAPELIAAVKFACANLKSPDDLVKGKEELPLAAINDRTDEGRTLFASAKQVLTNLGKARAEVLVAGDFADPARIFADSAFNGDGIITELSTEDDFLRSVIRDTIDCMGSDLDRSGRPGISSEKAQSFFDELKAYAEWQAEARARPDILPLALDKMADASRAVSTVHVKVDDYFARCRMAVYEPRISHLLNGKEEEYAGIVGRELSLEASELAGFPLAQVVSGRSLPLDGTANPAYRGRLKTLRDAAVAPLLGPRDSLSEADWIVLLDRVAPYDVWLAGKRGQRIEKLGPSRIAEILRSKAQEDITELLVRDKALEREAASIEDLERLFRYHRDLYRICTNFINFQDFYDDGEPSVFQCGTLYLDQRACRLCLRVDDPAKHAGMAGLAGAYLVYADCSRAATGEKMHIVAVVTNGDSDNLMVGRNGLFYDRRGRDWDATVVKIIDNPIGLRQAFWAPYKKLVRMIEEQVAKRAAVAETKSTATLSSIAGTTANVDKAELTEPKKVDVGSVAALGVAVGALGAFMTAVVGYATGILRMGVLATAGAVVGVMLLISLPSVVLAYITLRKRNLGPILDANGWAINANARINVAFGATLTTLARLPAGARREARDRYIDRGVPWKTVAFILLVFTAAYRWYEGGLDRVLPDYLESTTVLGEWAPEKPVPIIPSSHTKAK